MSDSQAEHSDWPPYGIVKHARNYPFCSAGWLELKASSVFLNQLATYDTSNLDVTTISNRSKLRYTRAAASRSHSRRTSEIPS